jgi:hypothetical protein
MILGTIVMLLIVGGLLYWKLGGSSDEETAPPPIASAPVKPPPTEVLPPPPPPPEEVPEEPEKPSDTKKPSGASAGCSGTCSGDAPPELQAALSGKASAARRCYERALLQNATLQGKVKVQVRVSASGRACSANIVENGLGDPGIATCITRNFMGSSYPAPQGGCVDVAVPMNFMPKQ